MSLYLTVEEIDELEVLAKKATGGEWSVEQHGPNPKEYVLYSGRNTVLPGTEESGFPMRGHGLNLMYISEPDWNGDNNFAYLSKVSPDTILKLINRIRNLEEVL
jgi:hypothetical protein